MKVLENQQVHLVYVKCRPVLRDPVAACSMSPMCKTIIKCIPGIAHIPVRIICTSKTTGQLISMLTLTVSGYKIPFSEITM